MQELKKNVLSIRGYTKKHKNELHEEFSQIVSGNEELYFHALTSLFNSTTLCSEVLHYYYGIWSKNYSINDKIRQNLMKENGERVMELLK